jgi:hypothetical protein
MRLAEPVHGDWAPPGLGQMKIDPSLFSSFFFSQDLCGMYQQDLAYRSGEIEAHST